MIKTLQAIFYITWILVGIILIVSVFIGIATLPFEKIGALMGGRPLSGDGRQGDQGMETPSGPQNGPSPQMQQGGPPQIDERTRQVLTRLLGKQRADQIKTWDDITAEERNKMEQYFGRSMGGGGPGGSGPP